MKLSFIVVTYKRGALLQRCLDSIYTQETLPSPFEIIVIDNGGDAQVQLPGNEGIQLHIERPDSNLGAAAGRNLGIQRAKGEILVLLDDDAAWHQNDDVAKLLNILATYPQCGAAVGQSQDPQGAPIRVELPHPNKVYLLGVKSPVEVPYCFVTGVAFRGDLLRSLGGYPARLNIYMEELDLSLRLIDAGFHIIYDPLIATYHYKSNLGRPVVGATYWRNSAINKCRVTWKLLPFPYPVTTFLIWTVAAFVKTHSFGVVVEILRTLWAERALLAQERSPIHPETVRYLKRIGARLLY